MITTGPLQGLRVVEIAQWVAAPAAGAIFADWGADVIHIEHPSHGDGLRGLQALRGAGVQGLDKGDNLVWELTNRGKRSVTIDLNHPAGRAALGKLLDTADLLITALRPYELKKFGLIPRAIAADHPKLTQVVVTAWGTEGPRANEGGFDYTAFWAATGLMDTMKASGQEIPPFPRPGVGDRTTSLAVALAALAGIVARTTSGRGRAFGVSLYGIGLWVNGLDVQAALAGHEPKSHNRNNPTNPLVNIYKTKDKRWLLLNLTQSERYWSQLCTAISRPGWVYDPDFLSFESREANSAMLADKLSRIFRTRTLADWMSRLSAEGLIFAPVWHLREVIQDQQALDNHFIVGGDESSSELSTVGRPAQLLDAAESVVKASPACGEHTAEVLLAAGYSMDDIAALHVQGAI